MLMLLQVVIVVGYNCVVNFNVMKRLWYTINIFHEEKIFEVISYQNIS